MIQTRRDFIQKSTLALAGLSLVPHLTYSESIKYTAIQLWTVRDEMSKDPKETLKKIAKMGYNEVEAYGWDFFGLNPKPFKEYITSLGLKMRSAHGALMKNAASDPIPTNLQESIDRSLEAGLKYFVVPYMQEKNYDTVDSCMRTAEYLNLYGEMCKKSGLQLAYHNHDFEFTMRGDKTVYEHVLDNTDPNLVKCEMDLYWVTVAGKDPIDLFKKYPGRFPLWHVKDKHKSLGESTEIGNGKIDFSRIFKQKTLSGLELPVVEQESYQGKAQSESAKICIKNFKKIKF